MCRCSSRRFPQSSRIHPSSATSCVYASISLAESTLTRQATSDEVNFWQPSGKAPFVGLEPGAPFLFKLKRPFNHVAGGVYFVKFSPLPLSMVWEAFGNKNGAASRAAFELMIRRLAPDPGAKDPYVGCTILTDPCLLAQREMDRSTPRLERKYRAQPILRFTHRPDSDFLRWHNENCFSGLAPLGEFACCRGAGLSRESD